MLLSNFYIVCEIAHYVVLNCNNLKMYIVNIKVTTKNMYQSKLQKKKFYWEKNEIFYNNKEVNSSIRHNNLGHVYI